VRLRSPSGLSLEFLNQDRQYGLILEFVISNVESILILSIRGWKLSLKDINMSQDKDIAISLSHFKENLVSLVV